MKLIKQVNEHLSETLHPVSLEGGQQNQRNRREVDHPANSDQPDCTGQLLMYKLPVQEIQNQRDHGSHGLVGDKADSHRHGAVPYRNPRFPQGIDLHGLSARGAGCDIAVIKADQGDIDGPADADFKALSPQVKPVIHAVANGINQPARKNAQQPDAIHLFDRVKGIGKIFIAECDKENSGDGKCDKQKAQQFFES